MTIAEIHGKSALTKSEDFLTADVFTAFRYLPADTGIAGFLHSIEGMDGVLPAPRETATAAFYFWPVGATREPDVLIELDIDGELYHVVVEAKYLSGPSDREIVEVERGEETVEWGNQLADQLRELRRGEYRVRQEGVRLVPKTLASRPSNRLLLYLTSHPLQPVDDMARALAAGEPCWANWYDVYDYLAAQREHHSAFPYNRIVADLLTLLKLKGFSSYEGVLRPPPLKPGQNNGSFWRGRTTPLPSFHGIRRPPAIGAPPTSVGDGSFWKEEEEKGQ